MSLLELRMFAYVAWASAAHRRIALGDLALVQAPNGRPIGVRAAGQVLRDLADTGVLSVGRSIDNADADTPLSVFVAGRQQVPASAEHVPSVSAPTARRRVPTQRDGTPIPMVGPSASS